MSPTAPYWIAPAMVAAALAAGCYASPAGEGPTLCEEAALYRESCTGEYITPPPCGEEAEANAERILQKSCNELESLADAGKADGTFCDWFGVTCSEDESIFRGPQCDRDSDCSGDGDCIEGRCFAGVASEEFADVLDEHTAATEVGGNAVDLLVDNKRTRTLREELVAEAEHSIHLSALNVTNAGVSRHMVDQFAEAVDRGVEVRVVVDSLAQNRFDRDILERMVDAGVDLLVFNPARAWAQLRLGLWGFNVNNRFHEKMFIVDGRDAIVGGRNTGSAYLRRGGVFDLDVHVRGPGVTEVQRRFLEMWDRVASWEREAGCPKADEHGFYCPEPGESLLGDPAYTPEQPRVGSSRTRALRSVPWEQDTSEGYFTHVSLVRGARESITIANGYFVPPRRLRNHLREAAKRGVDVKVLKNSEESHSHPRIYYASLNFYKELIEAGVDIREYQGRSMLHAKAMVVDGEFAVVSSYNLSPRSAESNSESLLLLRDSPLVGELKALFEEEIAEAEPANANLSFRERLRARAHRTVEWLF